MSEWKNLFPDTKILDFLSFPYAPQGTKTVRGVPELESPRFWQRPNRPFEVKPLQGLFCPVMSRKNLTVEDQLLNLYIGKVLPIVFSLWVSFLYTRSRLSWIRKRWMDWDSTPQLCPFCSKMLMQRHDFLRSLEPEITLQCISQSLVKVGMPEWNQGSLCERESEPPKNDIDHDVFAR